MALDLEQREACLQDKVAEIVEEYNRIVNEPSFQTMVNNQRRYWLTRRREAEKKYGKHNPILDLYDLYYQCGAVSCPFEIYSLFVDLYMTERELHGEESQVKLRDINSYGTDQWILLTESTDDVLPAGLHYNQHILLGMDVRPGSLSNMAFAANEESSHRKWLGQDKLPGCLNQMTSDCTATLEDGGRHYAATSRLGWGVCLYSYNAANDPAGN